MAPPYTAQKILNSPFTAPAFPQLRNKSCVRSQFPNALIWSVAAESALKSTKVC
jgi:hypothetical protein